MMSYSSGNPKPAIVTGYPVSASRSEGAPPRPPIYRPPPTADAPPSPLPFCPRPRPTEHALRRCYDDYFIYALLILLTLAFLVSVGIGLFVFEKKSNAYRLRTPEFAVSSACVSGFNLSAHQQQLSASFDLNLTIHSPNRKARIYYGKVTASVLYGSDVLSEISLAPFYLGPGETSVLRVRLAALGEHVNSDVVRGIESDRRRGDGAVGFNFTLFSWVRIFPAWIEETRWSESSVHCGDLLIGFGGNGTNAAATGYLLGSAPKQCMVNL